MREERGAAGEENRGDQVGGERVSKWSRKDGRIT